MPDRQQDDDAGGGAHRPAQRRAVGPRRGEEITVTAEAPLPRRSRRPRFGRELPPGPHRHSCLGRTLTAVTLLARAPTRTGRAATRSSRARCRTTASTWSTARSSTRTSAASRTACSIEDAIEETTVIDRRDLRRVRPLHPAASTRFTKSGATDFSRAASATSLTNESWAERKTPLTPSRTHDQFHHEGDGRRAVLARPS